VPDDGSMTDRQRHRGVAVVGIEVHAVGGGGLRRSSRAPVEADERPGGDRRDVAGGDPRARRLFTDGRCCSPCAAVRA
jgi:hypothetical protein